MSFVRYPHLEKFGNTAVDAIEFGITHLFPKLDGTNASAWWDNTKGFCAGSRNRQLDTVNHQNDNQGFAKYASNRQELIECCLDNSSFIFYGEWLVPHTIKHYREDAWNKFWIFDVYNRETGKFIPYDDYKPLLEKYNLDYIPCIKMFKNGSWENFLHEAKNNRFLLPEDKLGEGVVIKNYEWTNKFQQVTWAKIVNAEFKDDFVKVMGASMVDGRSNAQVICDTCCTPALIEKEYAKLVNSLGVDSNTNFLDRRYIPRLLHTVFYSVVTEELWDSLKKISYGTVNFKELQQLCILKVKEVKKELF